MAQRRDRVGSHTFQTVATRQAAASTVLLPLSGNLRVDSALTLSDQNFKQSIEEFYAKKQLSTIDQLNATPPYPTPHVLAQFANKAYADNQHVDPKPPAGWQLLTTASHAGIKNGYFGTAYWHPEHQQVVIAHRGTLFTNVGALVADVKGVLFNNYVQQMNSASTFAHKVVAVLQQIEQEKKVSFELFFTGHSLGGWLAQITAFTTEYLEVKGCIFRKKQKKPQGEKHASRTVQDSHDFQKDGLVQLNPLNIQYIKDNPDVFIKKGETKQGEQIASSTVENSYDVTQSYHPHTVVFDSPGCKDMLLQMADKLDVRLKGRSVDLHHLDITSYLSAPNFINTCNSHLGTVYRIFTDLSDMGWKETQTPLYHYATHRIDKIVQAFDPETGQVRKDDKGKLKIREVVDWPVRAGIRHGSELNYFFEMAKHLNNYLPEVTDISHSKVPKGYHRLRYQTKPYDECTKSLTVFTPEERELLASYMWLRELQTPFKLKGCFSVMNNPEAENKAEQNLQNYELDNESVRCADASTLQALIPYVKRLVRFFPHVRNNIKDQLSPPDIIKKVYQYETGRNVAKIKQSPLDCKPKALGLTEFLTNGQQIWQLRMIDGDAWTAITKVYWVLQKTSCTSNYLSEDDCTVLTLDWLLTVKGMINLNALLASIPTPHLLMIACGTNQTDSKELRDMFQEFFSILKEKKNMKTIVTTQSDEETADCIQEIATETFGEGFIAADEQLTWSDLTASSQIKMLEKTVIFQGKRVALNQLISAETMTDSFPLACLLQETELRIGEKPVPSACSSYNVKFYIDRTFNHNITISQDISSDKQQGKFFDLLASTEQEFKQLCQQNPKENVHWIEKEKSGEFIWRQSQGSLQTLRKYIHTHMNHSYAPSDLDNLLQEATHQRVMLIADKAGMGKTTVLTHLSNRIKQNFPAHWLVRIDLNDCTELLNTQKGKMDKGRVLEFLSNDVLKLESNLEKLLFNKYFEGNETNKLLVIVDGFDEISPKYKQTVLDMLQVLKQTSLEQLWVTTRPHLREDLEDNLQQLSYTLQPFSEEDQVEFLKKFWSHNSNFEAMRLHRLESYAKALIKMFAQSISDKDKQFTGIPLQTRLLAEVFEKDFRSFYLLNKPDPELPHKLNLLGLYTKFIESKYDIYYREKPKTAAGNLVAEDVQARDKKNIELQHQLLALQALFTEDQVTSLQISYQSPFSDEELARIGIVQRNSEGKPQFIHRTFAEYFVAELLINHLTNETKPEPRMQELLLNRVLLETDCHVIRAFLEGQLEQSEPSDKVLKEAGKKLDEQWKEREEQGTLKGVTTALHEAAKEDNVHIIEFLQKSLKSGEELSTVKKMLLHKDRWGQTAWQKAAQSDSVQALTAIWEWAQAVTTCQEGAERVHSEASDTTCGSVDEEELRPNQLKNKLFEAKDQYGNTAWHGAAQRGSLKALETLWSWAKETGLNLHELLLNKNEEGNTAWQVAVKRGNSEVLEKIWDWAKEKEINRNDLKKEFLLAKDKIGYTVWNRAAESGSLETLETLWCLGKEAELKPDEMFLAKGTDGNAAWQVAAKRGHFEMLEKLWEWAKREQMGGNVLRDRLLLAKDQGGYTAWHRAAERGNLKALETLWGWAKEVKLNPDELLMAKSKKGLTAWHLAADRDHFETFKKMWEWAKDELKNQNDLKKDDAQNDLKKDKLNPNELKKKLFLAKDETGYTVWHRASQRGTLEELETLWKWAKSGTKPRLAQNEKENAARQ